MAAITIRNLPDEVVDALKKRAKRNSRSMEAEVRDVVTRLAADESALENGFAESIPPRRISVGAPRDVQYIAPDPIKAVRTSDLRAWMAAHPPPPVDGAAWLADIRADGDIEDFRDPWTHRASS